jgi:hypothetical protein
MLKAYLSQKLLPSFKCTVNAYLARTVDRSVGWSAEKCGRGSYGEFTFVSVAVLF